jgi:hypothetical protein
MSARNRLWAKKNRAILREVERRARVRFNLWFEQLKAGPCVDCGYTYDAICMDWDHVRGRKRYNVGAMRGMKKAIILREIAKCELVCANCHRVRTKQRKEIA